MDGALEKTGRRQNREALLRWGEKHVRARKPACIRVASRGSGVGALQGTSES